MENKLPLIFDYQKFAGNRKLQNVIDSVHRRPKKLSLEEADLVSAAGSPYYRPNSDDPKENHP